MILRMERLDTLLAFLAEDPSDAFTRFALAQEYARAGDLDAARAHYETLRREQPTYVGVYYHLGKLLETLGQPGEAAAVYRSGIAEATRARDLHARAELQTALLAAEGVGDE